MHGNVIPQGNSMRISPTRAFLAVVTVPIAIELALLLTAVIAVEPAHGAEANPLFSALMDPSSPAACHKAAEVKPALFPNQQTVTHDFSGAEADKLKPVMAALIEQPVPEAALIRVVFLPEAQRAWAFQFGADGCHTVTLALDVPSLEMVFATARMPSLFLRA
jgi:hypothetical protein